LFQFVFRFWICVSFHIQICVCRSFRLRGRTDTLEDERASAEPRATRSVGEGRVPNRTRPLWPRRTPPRAQRLVFAPRPASILEPGLGSNR
jgi:hypothetical protein